MDLPELAQTNCSSQGQWQSQNRGRFLMWSKVHHCNNNSGSWIQKETGWQSGWALLGSTRGCGAKGWRGETKLIFSKGDCWCWWKCLFLFKLMYSREFLWDNSLRGLFVERKIIKISIKSNCVSLLLHMHKYRHTKFKFYPSNSIPASRRAARVSK